MTNGGHIELAISWAGVLSDQQAGAIASSLGSIADATAELNTENTMGGVEQVFNTIILEMAKEAAKKLVDAVVSGIALLRKAGSLPDTKTVTLVAKWAGGESRITLPADNEFELKRRLSALAELIAAS